MQAGRLREGPSPAGTLTLAQRDLCQAFSLRNWKLINVCRSKSLHVWSLATSANGEPARAAGRGFPGAFLPACRSHRQPAGGSSRPRAKPEAGTPAAGRRHQHSWRGPWLQLGAGGGGAVTRGSSGGGS